MGARSLWGKRAEALGPYLTKGKQINAVLGDVHIQTFKKQDGSDGVNLEGRIEDLELARGARQEASAPPPPPPPAPTPKPASTGFDDMDDDIPF